MTRQLDSSTIDDQALVIRYSRKNVRCGQLVVCGTLAAFGIFKLAAFGADATNRQPGAKPDRCSSGGS